MEYWVIINEEQQGPMTLEALLKSEITPETLVWHAGLETWTPASEIASLQGIFAKTAVSDAEEDDELVNPVDAEGDVVAVEIPDIPQQPDFPPIPVQEPEPSKTEEAQSSVTQEKCPPTNLVWAILAAILCCTPLAIPGIIFAVIVRKKYNKGDYEGAFKASERAALWTILSIVIGLIYQPFSAVISMLTSL